MSNDSIPNNIAETILSQAQHEAESRVEAWQAHDETPVKLLVARQGVSATILQASLDQYAAIPRSRAGKLRAFDVPSFAQLILRDYDAGSVVFADVGGTGVQFEACLDYHHPTGGTGYTGGRGGQRHGRETVIYDPNLSDEWKAWTKQAGQPMSQGQFAQWIDDHLPDIADPRHLLDSPECTAAKLGEVYGFTRENLWGYADPAALVKVSQGFEIREGAVVKSAVRLESGEVSITYQTEHTDGNGAPLKVPTRFLLSIPVFEREASYLVPVKLAYRKSGGNLVWSFELFRPDRFRDDAIEGMVRALGLALTLPPTVAPGAGPVVSDPSIPAPVVPIVMAKRANGEK